MRVHAFPVTTKPPPLEGGKKPIRRETSQAPISCDRYACHLSMGLIVGHGNLGTAGMEDEMVYRNS